MKYNNIYWSGIYDQLCDLLWQVQKGYAVNREGSWKYPMSYSLIFKVNICSMCKLINFSFIFCPIISIHESVLTYDIPFISCHCSISFITCVLYVLILPVCMLHMCDNCIHSPGAIKKYQHFHDCTNSTLFQTPPPPPPLHVYRPIFLDLV